MLFLKNLSRNAVVLFVVSGLLLAGDIAFVS